MQLKVKDINLSSGGPLIAVLNEKDGKKFDLKAKDRIRIHKIKSETCIIVVVDITDKGVEEGEIGLFDEVMHKFKIEPGTSVNITYEPKPQEIQFIRKKLDGFKLNASEIKKIIKGVVENRFSDVELTYFVSGCYSNGLNMKETVALTQAIVETGKRLTFKEKPIIDKHCAGGVPNNRTTMIMIPLLASMGFKMPKTSSRAITSPSGTADTMEVLAPVALSEKRIKQVIKKTNACMVWGGSMNLAAADDILIKVRHPLRLDPEGMLLASIMAKKKAVGATHVLIDLPFGYGSKFPTKKDAKKIGKKFERLGKHLSIKTLVVYTDGSQTIGKGVGPALEVADVIEVLNGKGAEDLRKKSLYLTEKILRMLNVKKPGFKAQHFLDSGKALKKFKEIIVAQGGKKHFEIPKAKYRYDVKAQTSGTIKSIYNKGISKVARLAGAPQDKTAGLYLWVHKNAKVKKGDVLFTIHSESKAKLENTLINLKNLETITII
ncbi:MAG: thymidine phosphorylase [Nanoarchaeota archaeon]|nr:thymidine phosphorylase [Nanoarchaeota archaeon]